jgi:hypothetical protein
MLVIVNTRNNNINLSLPVELTNNNWICAIIGESASIQNEIESLPYQFKLLLKN